MSTPSDKPPTPSPWSSRYRGATVEDLDPPLALSTSPHAPISTALLSALERDYTHLTVLDPSSKTLLGYISIPQLQTLLRDARVRDTDPVEKAMIRFQRRGKRYRLITMETPLAELEAFFEGADVGGKEQDFAVVTDGARRFVLGVATREDLKRFVERRPV